jgi:hypothetical protein
MATIDTDVFDSADARYVVYESVLQSEHEQRQTEMRPREVSISELDRSI